MSVQSSLIRSELTCNLLDVTYLLMLICKEYLLSKSVSLSWIDSRVLQLFGGVDIFIFCELNLTLVHLNFILISERMRTMDVEYKCH